MVNSLVSWWSDVMMMMGINKYDDFNPSVFVVAIVLVILAILWSRRLSSSSNGAPPLPPGPRSLPIVGYLPFVGSEPHNQFAKMADTYGPIFKVYLGSRLHIFIRSPELAKEMFRDNDETFSNRNDGIVATTFSYGPQDVVWSKNNSTWRNLRKILVQEVLNNKSIQETSSFRKDEVSKTIKNVFTKLGTNISISELCFSTEANILASMVWGNSMVEKAAKDGQIDQAEFHLTIAKIFGLLGKPNLSDLIPSLAWLDPQGIGRDTKREFKKMDHIITMFINNRIEYNSRRSKDAVQHEGRKDLLQVLLELHDQKNETSPSMTHIKALIMDILLAGIDTSITVLEWAVTQILKNSHVMNKVQEELEKVVGLDSKVEESHLPKLEYLNATLKETLRLHPVGAFGLPRSPSQTCVVGGYTIPKGSTILVTVREIHRDPRYWDNPLEFNPDRFLTQEGTKKWDYQGNDFRFLPFGSGRRVCPGYTLANKMQMYILASLFHSFNWSLPKGEEHDLSEIFLGVSIKRRKPLTLIPSQRLFDVSLYM